MIFKAFKKIVQTLEDSDTNKEKVLQLLDLLILFQHQNEQKLAGEKHIPNRIVSFDEPDARPIKKGKKHPNCEFGSTLQLSFNRQGFMVTMENFIGKPNDKTLWSDTARLFEEKMKPLKITQTKLAQKLGISYPRLNEIIKGRRSVTPDTALRLSRVLGMPADFWLGLQQDWDLWHAMNSPKAIEIEMLQPLSKQIEKMT